MSADAVVQGRIEGAATELVVAFRSDPFDVAAGQSIDLEIAPESETP